MQKIILITCIIGVGITSCKKKGCTDPLANNYEENATRNDGSCTYDAPQYVVPSSYNFTDGNGNSTVNYSGQTERLNQLRELVSYMKTGTAASLSAQQLKDMFANTGGNGNGAFSFTSTKQLKDKCFSLDQTLYEKYMDSIALASAANGMTASNGQAGVLTSGTSTYLFSRNGIEYLQLIEKGLMGAVLMNQALNVYFSASKMDVDNSTAVDPANDLYYTTMEHHWDEAFGYFGVSPDFPSILPTDFWGKYCNSQDASLNSNKIMMNNFLKGRAAISNDALGDRDEAIAEIRMMWENIAARQAISYLDEASTNFGSNQAKVLHVLSEAYAFTLCLRYTPTETRKLTNAQVDAILAKFGSNFWNISLNNIQSIKADLDAVY